jgi:required for meiotic nuclear division protein 1
MAEPASPALPDSFPGGFPETLAVRSLLVGGRIDTRGFERKDSLAATPLAIRIHEGGIAVLFRYGVAVLFDAPREAEQGLLRRLAPHVIEPLPAPEVDELRLRISPGSDEQADLSGTIYLNQASIERFQVVADVLAKSQVLSHYELRIAGIFDRTEPLAGALKASGRAGAGGSALVREIGDVLLMQHRMVGRVETAEKPELVWDHPELERLYLRLAEEYELRDRSRALERKLEVISRTAETLLGLVQNRSSLRVEWYILALIVAELILSVYPMVAPR